MERDTNVTSCKTVLYLNLAGNAVFPVADVLLYFCAPTPTLQPFLVSRWCLWAPHCHVSLVVRIQL